MSAAKAIGVAVDCALAYVSALYGLCVASCLPALRGDAAQRFDLSIDIPLWCAALLLPTSAWLYVTRLCGVVVLVVCWTLLPAAALVWTRSRFAARRGLVRGRALAPGTVSVGVFHPNCDQGGGGERVLWSLLHHLTRDPALSHVHFHVYTQPPLRMSDDGERATRSGGDADASGVQILAKVRQTFGFNLLPVPGVQPRVHFVWLRTTAWLDSARYPRLTLVLQALGSVMPAVEALWAHTPHAFLDTCGYPFAYPVFRVLGGCHTACYTHYPTISKNMLQRADGSVGGGLKGTAKLWYYRAFARWYALAGRCVHTAMANSSWTMDQLCAVWGGALQAQGRLHCVYPPCMVSDVTALPLTPRLPFLLSVAQFRPEKRHDLLLRVFAALLRDYTAAGGAHAQQLKLVFVGTLRDRDRAKVAELKALAESLDIDKRVVFETDVTNESLKRDFLGHALIGLHAMRDEHFGIGIVELMAGGVVTIANRSGGPLSDIVVPPAAAPASAADASTPLPRNHNATGYLCETVEEYANAALQVLHTFDREPDALAQMQRNARQHVGLFSEEAFGAAVRLALLPDLTAIRTL